MKIVLFSLSILVSLSIFLSCTGPSYKYLLFEAKNEVAAVEGKFPLMIFLHGSGERGEDLSLVKKHGPPKMVETDKDFPFYLISPQMPEHARWEAAPIKKIIDEVVSKYPIDENRIYLTGLSMGGYGTWVCAFAYPDFFAAIAPICGGAEKDANYVDKIPQLPVWAFHGAADKVVPESNTAAIMSALKKINPQAKYTVYPEVGHDSWTETYANPALYSWMLSHQKQ